MFPLNYREVWTAFGWLLIKRQIWYRSMSPRISLHRGLEPLELELQAVVRCCRTAGHAGRVSARKGSALPPCAISSPSACVSFMSELTYLLWLRTIFTPFWWCACMSNFPFFLFSLRGSCFLSWAGLELEIFLPRTPHIADVTTTPAQCSIFCWVLSFLSQF